MVPIPLTLLLLLVYSTPAPGSYKRATRGNAVPVV